MVLCHRQLSMCLRLTSKLPKTAVNVSSPLAPRCNQGSSSTHALFRYEKHFLGLGGDRPWIAVHHSLCSCENSLLCKAKLFLYVLYRCRGTKALDTHMFSIQA